MPKYYIKSGDIKYIIDRNTHDEAILEALRACKDKGYFTGPKICVSETGFENHKVWKCYNTSGYLKDLKDKK
jgi:hypothetical protein